MKVTLNIENDAELRAYIKDCIKGQVLAIVRDDFKAMIQHELERKIKGIDERRFEQLQKDAMNSAMQTILRQEHNVSTWNHNFIKPYIESIVDKTLTHNGTNWNDIINQIATEKIKALIK